VSTSSQPEAVRVLAPDGSLLGEPPKLTDEQLTAMVRLMMLGRRIDQKAISLQRRGKLGTFAPMSGQEAATVGSAFALDPERDWVVPQYREQLAMLHFGLPLSTYLLQRMGHPVGSELPAAHLYAQQVALAAHLPHAVGLAWGLRLRGQDAAVIAYFGDGASSEGDFHEAANLAGVVRAPVLFFCQNNGWAISTPWHLQSAASSIASRGIGYGMPGVQVDGNDLLAVYQVTREAVERARAGGGPTLIEAITTRLGAHTTADDPSRYLPEGQVERDRALDPIVRVTGWLTADGRWDPAAERAATAWCDEQIDRAVAEFDATPPPEPDLFFRNVFVDEPVRLRRQHEEFLASRSRPPDGRPAARSRPTEGTGLIEGEGR
jgi:pyruvate dehydrogenase E1 component alpha subunit